PSLNDGFVELHIWNAVHEQTANTIRFLEHRHSVARRIKLCCTGQTCWSRSNDGHSPSRPSFRRTRNNPTLIETTIDDRTLDRLDCHWLFSDRTHTRSFTRRGANSPRELRKVVCFVQELERRLPTATMNEIVPVGNQIVERTA